VGLKSFYNLLTSPKRSAPQRPEYGVNRQLWQVDKRLNLNRRLAVRSSNHRRCAAFKSIKPSLRDSRLSTRLSIAVDRWTFIALGISNIWKGDYEDSSGNCKAKRPVFKVLPASATHANWPMLLNKFRGCCICGLYSPAYDDNSNNHNDTNSTNNTNNDNKHAKIGLVTLRANKATTT